MQINSNSTIAFEDLLKIFRLLKNEQEANQKVAVKMLEGMGFLEELVHDLVFRLTTIPLSNRQREHGTLRHIILRIAYFKTGSDSNIKRAAPGIFTLPSLIDLAMLSESFKWELMKLSCRVQGYYQMDILKRENIDSLRLAALWMEIFRQKGKGFELLPLSEHQIKKLDISGLHEFLPNLETVGDYPIEKVIQNRIPIINISDFLNLDLSPSILAKLKGRTLKMRAGFYERNKKILDNFTEVSIEIDRENHFPSFQYFRGMTPEKTRQIKVDWNVFHGKFLTVLYKVDSGLLPNELERIKNVEVLYLPDASLRTIPYRLHRLKKLKYLFITANRSKYKIKRGLLNHPTLEGIIYRKRLHQTSYSDIKIESASTIQFFPKRLINPSIDEVVNLEEMPYKMPFEIKFELDEIENYSTQVVEKPTAILQMNSYKMNYPLPIFEEINNPSNVLTDEEYLKILKEVVQEEMGI